MSKRKTSSSADLADAVIKGMQEVKGKEIISIDLRKIPNAVCDYFVICHGTSNKHVEALAESVEKEVYKSLEEDPIHKEGREQAEWILLDYFNVVVHIFQRESREFYGLEKLWADADVKEVAYEEVDKTA